MQVIKKQNIVVVFGTYQKEGKEKKIWKPIGEIITFQGDDGEFSKVNLFSMPGANISLFEQKQKEEETDKPF